jgi:hypothetical protein
MQEGEEEWPPIMTKLILLDSLLQEVEATLPHLVLQNRKKKWHEGESRDSLLRQSGTNLSLAAASRELPARPKGRQRPQGTGTIPGKTTVHLTTTCPL